MTVRAALLPLLLLVFAAPVLAQPRGSVPQSPLTVGSLTVMSRPGGAAVRITGDQSVVGRTPFTLDRGLAGRYVVTGSEIGYERWRRAVTLDGVSADTIWMTLGEKNAAMAGLRSMIVPGWGQFYGDHPGRGTIFLTSAILAGAGYVFADLRYDDRVEEYRAADERYQAATDPNEIAAAFAARADASRRAQDAYDLRRAVVIAGGVIWGLSVVEAVVSLPRPVGPILLGGRVGAPLHGAAAFDPGLTVTLARVDF
jgi:hypothetical protein